MIEAKPSIQLLSRLKDFGSDRSAFVRMDKNERSTSFPDTVFQEMMSSISSELIPMYPDQRPLYKKLSSFLGVEEDCLLLSSGSDAALKMIFETYISPHDEIILLDPTYAMVEVYANMFEAKQIKIKFSPDLLLPFDTLLSSISSKTRVVFIADPNQPTGTILKEDQVVLLLDKALKTDTLVIFDEAYYNFSQRDSVLSHLMNYPNLIITRTFSKAFGLASVRLGYVISHSQIIDCLYKVKTLADINLFALKLGEYLLDNYHIVEEYVQSVNKSKLLVEDSLQLLGIECIGGHANFMHLRLPEKYDLKEIVEKMNKQGYLIRAMGSGLPATLEGCIRISVGPVDQMKEFLEVFQKVVQDYS
jgi:histidinol-phosphate aminotransferase